MLLLYWLSIIFRAWQAIFYQTQAADFIKVSVLTTSSFHLLMNSDSGTSELRPSWDSLSMTVTERYRYSATSSWTCSSSRRSLVAHTCYCTCTTLITWAARPSTCYVHKPNVTCACVLGRCCGFQFSLLLQLPRSACIRRRMCNTRRVYASAKLTYYHTWAKSLCKPQSSKFHVARDNGPGIWIKYQHSD